MEMKKIEKKKEDLLPELKEEEIDWAIAPEQKSWVYKALGRGPGYVWIDHENGYAMQIGWNGFQLLSIVDHDWCTHYVSLINATLESIGHELDMENTIIRPYRENPENNENRGDENTTDIVGLEVA